MEESAAVSGRAGAFPVPECPLLAVDQKAGSCADVLENGLEDTGRGKGKLGQSERVAWTYIHYQT